MTSRARRGKDAELPRLAAMPKRGRSFGDVAPLQLKVRVGWRELGRGVNAEHYSQEIFGECGVGLPATRGLCSWSPQAELLGAARSGTTRGRLGFGSSEWGMNAPTSTCAGHSSIEVPLSPQTSGLSVVPPPGSVLRGCRTRAVVS